MSRIILAIAFVGLAAFAVAEQPWLGNWVSSDKPSENWDAIVQAMGLPVEKYGGNIKTHLKMSKEGDLYKSEMSTSNFQTSWNFKLGEESVHVEPKFNNTEIRYTLTQDGDKLLAEVKIPARNKVIHEVYEVVGAELVKSFKVDGINGKRYFNKDIVA